MTKFVNLTPHEIKVVRKDGSELRLPPSGQVARVMTASVPVSEVDGVEVVRTEFGAVEGVPEPREGVYYIVSSMVAQALSWRSDVLAPDTSPASAVRDEQGRIVGIRRFQVFQ